MGKGSRSGNRVRCSQNGLPILRDLSDVCAAPGGDTTRRRAAMAEQTSTENQRPALYRIVAGNILKGARVQILGTTDQKPLDTLKPMDRLWVREDRKSTRLNSSH